MTVIKEEVSLPEGTHLGMFDYSAIDGARAAKELLTAMNKGEYVLDEKSFKRDFLPILLGRVELTESILANFSDAWKAVAGSLQSCLGITRNGVYVYSVPPIFSAHGAVITQLNRMGSDGIRLNIEVLNAKMTRIIDRNALNTAYADIVFSKMPSIKINPEYLRMWQVVLKECGVTEPIDIKVEKSTVLDITDIFEEGEDV
jgi:hypothetical protein